MRLTSPAVLGLIGLAVAAALYAWHVHNANANKTPVYTPKPHPQPPTPKPHPTPHPPTPTAPTPPVVNPSPHHPQTPTAPKPPVVNPSPHHPQTPVHPPVPEPPKHIKPTPLPVGQFRYMLPNILFHQGNVETSTVLHKVPWQWCTDIVQFNTEKEGALFSYGTATYQATTIQQAQRVFAAADEGSNSYKIADAINTHPVSGWKMYNTKGQSIVCSEALAKDYKITVGLPGPYFAQALKSLASQNMIDDTWTVLFTGLDSNQSLAFPLNPPSGNVPLWLTTMTLYQWTQFTKAYSVAYSTTNDQAYADPAYTLVSTKNESAAYKKIGMPYVFLFNNGKYRNGSTLNVENLRLVVKLSKDAFCIGNPDNMANCPTTMQQICSTPDLLWQHSQKQFPNVGGPANRVMSFMQKNCQLFYGNTAAPAFTIGCPSHWRSETQQIGKNQYTSCSNNQVSAGCNNVKFYEDWWWNCNKGGTCNAEALAQWMKKCNTYQWLTPAGNAIAQYAKKSL